MCISRKKSAFSMVEMLFVIMILGVLFVIMVPKIDNLTTKAREIGVKTDFRSYQIAFESVAREMIGLGDQVVSDDVMAVKLLNGHLDPALKISASEDYDDGIVMPTTGYEKAYAYKKDPWNEKYIFRYVDDPSAVSRDGMLLLVCKGRNEDEEITIETGVPTSDNFDETLGDIVASGDDYILGTLYHKGSIYSGTAGFTSNLAGVR